jgi:hypothetical protein
MRATGLSRSTVQRGLREPRHDRPGGGADADPSSGRRPQGLDGDRTSRSSTISTPWRSQRRLAIASRRSAGAVRVRGRLAFALQALGHRVSHTVVAELLRELGYSLQGNVKTTEGRQHPDRDAQFRYIAATVARPGAASAGDLGRYQEERTRGRVHESWTDLAADRRSGARPRPRFCGAGTGGGKAIPYGVYDLQRDEGWVSVGLDHDTASFAVNAIRRWWQQMGRAVYPRARTLVITADAGGSNGSRLRLRKWELQQFANRTGPRITVCHFPPGTSEWNRIEHRLFSHIAMNWRGIPLVSLAAIVSLIGSTQGRSGLRVRSEVDAPLYPAGVRITDAQMATIDLTPHAFHGEWNYTIRPRRRK